MIEKIRQLCYNAPDWVQGILIVSAVAIFWDLVL